MFVLVLACVIALLVLNFILCYLASSRISIPKEAIMKYAVSFHNEDTIIHAKEELFNLCNEKNIARKPGPSHPSVNVDHVEDILDLFSKKDDSPYVLPTFAAKGFASMPPAGFQIIAPVMMALRDETASLKAEVSNSVRLATQRDVRSMEHVVALKQDVDDVKNFIHELRNHEQNNFDSFDRIVSECVMNG